jgi:hypothetical protein
MFWSLLSQIDMKACSSAVETFSNFNAIYNCTRLKLKKNAFIIYLVVLSARLSLSCTMIEVSVELNGSVLTFYVIQADCYDEGSYKNEFHDVFSSYEKTERL